MPEQVEPRGGADVPAVPVAGAGALPAGALRGAGAGAGGHHAPRAGLPGPAVARRRAAPRALHQPAQRRRALQVRLRLLTPAHPFLPNLSFIHRIITLTN